MPRISLTDFVDVVSTSGTPKTTKVKSIKYRAPYHPATDFYRPIREQIIQIHRSGGTRAALNRLLRAITDPKKLTNYPGVVQGYNRWWGRKGLAWFDPPSDLFSQHGINVSVNPELGLEVNGSPHLIKLYFKASPLTKNRIDIITHIMEVSLRGQSPPGTVMSVLDTRSAKLISPTVPIPTLSATLNAELAYVAALWPQI